MQPKDLANPYEGWTEPNDLSLSDDEIDRICSEGRGDDDYREGLVAHDVGTKRPVIGDLGKKQVFYVAGGIRRGGGWVARHSGTNRPCGLVFPDEVAMAAELEGRGEAVVL